MESTVLGDRVHGDKPPRRTPFVKVSVVVLLVLLFFFFFTLGA